MARALREKNESDHVRAGVERGVERQGRGKATNFDHRCHGALLSVKALALSKGSEGGLGVGRLVVFRLSRAEVALDGRDFALRRRPHLGFRAAIKSDDPPALIG